MPKGIGTPHGPATRHAVSMLAAHMGIKSRPGFGPDVIPARILQRAKHMDVDDIRNMSIAQSKRERRLARNREIAGHQEPASETEVPGAG